MTAAPLAKIAQSFHRHRNSYETHATPQNLFARALARRLSRAAGARDFGTVFEFGSGSGNLTRALAARFAMERMVLNDLVAHPLPDHLPCPAHFLEGPVEAAPLPVEIDLLVSASAIQWLADPETALARLCAPVRAGGWLAISGFGPAQFRELAALGADAAAPSLMTPATLAAALPQGWRVKDCGQRVMRQWFDSPLAVLRHLRLTGVNGLARRGWTKRDLAEFSEAYLNCHADPAKRVPLSWNPVWVIARKEG